MFSFNPLRWLIPWCWIEGPSAFSAHTEHVFKRATTSTRVRPFVGNAPIWKYAVPCRVGLHMYLVYMCIYVSTRLFFLMQKAFGSSWGGLMKIVAKKYGNHFHFSSDWLSSTHSLIHYVWHNFVENVSENCHVKAPHSDSFAGVSVYVAVAKSLGILLGRCNLPMTQQQCRITTPTMILRVLLITNLWWTL